MISIDSISHQETIRYLGNQQVTLNSTMVSLLTECEEEILTVTEPRYLYKRIPVDETILQGNSIKEHLSNCEYAVLLCATIGQKVDHLIRVAQITDMAKAVVFNAMASVAIEQVCNRVEEMIAEENREFYLTWRFSPGYGDYPLDLQKEFLNILDAPRKIGLCTNDNYILTPIKSVTAVIGFSRTPIEKKRRGCANCNFVGTCDFRKAGTRCEF